MFQVWRELQVDDCSQEVMTWLERKQREEMLVGMLCGSVQKEGLIRGTDTLTLSTYVRQVPCLRVLFVSGTVPSNAVTSTDRSSHQSQGAVKCYR